MSGHLMAGEPTAAADGRAVRVALWRAMHVQVDPPPMEPAGTSCLGAGIVARTRFAEDLVAEKAGQGLAHPSGTLANNAEKR
jgi:hypothetical protein